MPKKTSSKKSTKKTSKKAAARSQKTVQKVSLEKELEVEQQGAVIRFIRNFVRRMISQIFSGKKHVKLGIYGPPNAGKTTLANRICKDWIGNDRMGSVSKVPHETRNVQIKEKVNISYKGKEITFNIIDTPGIATKIDYEEFMKFKIKEKQAKQRAKEATKGVIESIKWLDDVDCVLVVLDATENPYSQVNITIIGNLAARDIPVLIVGTR